MIETKIDEGGNQIVDLKNLLIIFFIVIMLVLLATFGLVIATYYIMDANTNDDGHITDIGGTPLLSSESVITIDNSTGPAGIHCSLTVLEDTPLLAMSDVSGKFSQGGGVGTIRLNKHTTYEFPAGNGQTMIILQGDRFRVLSTQLSATIVDYIQYPLSLEQERALAGCLGCRAGAHDIVQLDLAHQFLRPSNSINKQLKNCRGMEKEEKKEKKKKAGLLSKALCSISSPSLK
eukprot:CAMPEP_0201476036 /NCGR_PEP_ID=MMETSP0151_2-20130828/1336_1 /ASSEMBLY_ACC=CAM_ASM_000257 /TAXON_ID=200890 /ORGANISM="Paramoeba atlantica, Strain 621/1 / CCAP 1560/9" /LENGTH=232 /DNA_ID=CAMNT_0047856299 /DNA_START=109 /DNA_END=808 /DNA_ORIENTATION=-